MTGTVVWIAGLPSSGKSTLAGLVADALRERGAPTCVLDGDAVRGALVPAPGYDASSRASFYATLANLAALLARQGLVVLVPATSHLVALRELGRGAADRFVLVHVDASAETCARRDPKGLYAAARQGRIVDLPGLDVAFEVPEQPDVRATGGLDDEAVAAIVARCVERPHLRAVTR